MQVGPRKYGIVRCTIPHQPICFACVPPYRLEREVFQSGFTKLVAYSQAFVSISCWEFFYVLLECRKKKKVPTREEKTPSLTSFWLSLLFFYFYIFLLLMNQFERLLPPPPPPSSLILIYLIVILSSCQTISKTIKPTNQLSKPLQQTHPQLSSPPLSLFLSFFLSFFLSLTL